MNAVDTGKAAVSLFALFVSFLLSWPATASPATPLIIDRDLPYLSLTPHLDIFRSRDKTLTVDNIANNPLIEFTRINTRQLNLAYSKDRIWLRFSLANPGPEPVTLFVESEFTRLDYVSLHSQSPSGDWHSIRSGDRYPFAARPFKTRQLIFPLQLSGNTVETFYIEIESSSSLHIPLSIGSMRSLIEASEQRSIIDGIFYGVTLLVALIALVLTGIFQQKIFIYFFLHVVSTMMAMMSLDGTGYTFWPEAVLFQEVSVIIFQCLNSIFVVLFARSYLQLKSALPRADLVNRLFLIYCFFIMLASATIPYAVASFSIIVAEIIMIGWIFTQSLIRSYQGFRPAYAFTLAWSLFFSVIAFVTAANFGISHNYNTSIYGLKLAFMAEFFILLLGISYRLYLLRRAEQEAAQDALVARAENQAKNDALARVSHEIRTPLNSIMGVSELLTEMPLKQQQARYAETIRNASADLLQILNDILDHSRISSGQLQLESIPFSPLELANKTLSMFTPLAEKKNLELLHYFDPSLPDTMTGDPTRLKQVLTNLLNNAIKFTDTGTIQLRIWHDNSYPDRPILRFEVEDTGPGLQPGDVEKLFNSYTQGSASTARHHGGSGLGLSICKQLISQMGGEIGVKESQKTGSLFWVSLPQTTPPQKSLHKTLQENSDR